MAAIPEITPATVQAIYAAYEAKRAREPARGYLGASNIGHACDRALWYGFRWAEAEAFPGRMLRLFDQGQRAEARFVDELRSIGAEVHEVDEAGAQFAVSAVGGHLRGHMDGAALGLPEAPKTWHVLEFKTHNAKSFKALQAKGVREAKPMHWAQCQVYMHLAGMTRALYLAENKDTAELYEERIRLDEAAAEALIAKAARIVGAAVPPLRISEDPSWFECKWCSFHPVCHGTAAPLVNCRTCTHSTPVMEAGAWRCERFGSEIPLEAQRAGCGDHRYIPVLLERFAQPFDSDTAGNTVTYETQGGLFVNGAPPAGFTSQEIRLCTDKRALTNIPELQQWRNDLGATIAA